MGLGSYASRCWLFYLTEISAKHGAPCPPQGTVVEPVETTVPEEAERQRAPERV